MKEFAAKTHPATSGRKTRWANCFKIRLGQTRRCNSPPSHTHTGVCIRSPQRARLEKIADRITRGRGVTGPRRPRAAPPSAARRRPRPRPVHFSSSRSWRDETRGVVDAAPVGLEALTQVGETRPGAAGRCGCCACWTRGSHAARRRATVKPYSDTSVCVLHESPRPAQIAISRALDRPRSRSREL